MTGSLRSFIIVFSSRQQRAQEAGVRVVAHL